MALKIGKCLLEARLEAFGISKRELEKRAGVTSSQISEYITEKHAMSLETAKNIADTIGCRPEDLYEWIPESSRKSR
jgi:plasmid maintenance system antidote protein VapI